ncbi:MAG: hypothetical protein WBV93_00610 [Anaerobacillus sp.]
MTFLDCSTIGTTYKTLASMLNTDISTIRKFIRDNTYRVFNEGVYWRYDNLSFQDIKEFFNLPEEEYLIKSVTVFHISSSLDTSSFVNNGILNLKQVIKEDTYIKGFLEKYNIQIDQTNEEPPKVLYKGKEIDADIIGFRLNKDSCINGFLIKEGATENTNVTHICKTPEFILNLSDYTSQPGMIDDWANQATPCIISFVVDIESIDNTTYPYGSYDPNYFILSSIEYLLFYKTGYWSPHNNPMVFLKENICINPEQITSIDIINKN